jgi:hypothetical protein
VKLVAATVTWLTGRSFRRVREAEFPVPAIPPCERLHLLVLHGWA